MRIFLRVLLIISILALAFFCLFNFLAAASSHNVPQSTFNAIHLSELICVILILAFGYGLRKIGKDDNR